MIWSHFNYGVFYVEIFIQKKWKKFQFRALFGLLLSCISTLSSAFAWRAWLFWSRFSYEKQVFNVLNSYKAACCFVMKRFKLVDGSGEFADIPIKWDLCILCQRITREALQCPNDSKRSDKGAGYKSLAVNLQQFHDIGEVNCPQVSQLCNLDEGEGIEAALAAHSAKWHKSCRNLYNSTKLDRALKRKAQSVETDDCTGECSTQSLSDSTERFTRSLADTTLTHHCFFMRQV